MISYVASVFLSMIIINAPVHYELAVGLLFVFFCYISHFASFSFICYLYAKSMFSKHQAFGFHYNIIYFLSPQLR